MRLCKCGGVVTQHELVREREAWTCRECGRYEAVPVNRSERTVNEQGMGHELSIQRTQTNGQIPLLG